MVSAAVAGLLWWEGDGPLRAVTAPELRAAPEPFAATDLASTEEEAGPKTRTEQQIGSFERPERVPEYEILDERRNERDGAQGAWLMVDTRSHSEEEYVLITRHLKARYAYLDAVSVEFIDLTETLRYNGAAVIFNTPAGVGYIGYVYGPPNARGYDVRAAD
ncbi:hypothetical protein BH24ACT18_BH24ACT18_00200 [soil metagenome]